jgi:hypothetical protein
MRILQKLSIAALLIGMQATALSSNNYKDLVGEGYRWVNIDGPYASRLEDNAQQLSKNPTRDTKLRLLRAGSVYYLIEGSIVRVVQTESRTGMAEIQVPDLVPPLWTSARFLSKQPIRDAFSMVETPESIGWTFNESNSSRSADSDLLKLQPSSGIAVSSNSGTKDGNTH